MIKNFGKFKQWTGERLGQAKATNQTEDFQQLEHDTDSKKTGFDKVFEAADHYHHQLSKKKPSPEDGKTKCSPLEALANCWLFYASSFNQDTPLGANLINVGHAELKVAHLQDDYAASVRKQYVDLLQHGVHAYKDYSSLKKKLESRRLDYDAKVSRLQKSKKEKPEWEQEMQAAKMKYEETEYDLIQKMVALQEYEADQCQAIQQLVEAQVAYHQQALDVLLEVNHQMNEHSLGLRRYSTAPVTRSSTLSSQSSDESPSRHRSFKGARQSSVDSLSRQPAKVVRAASFSSSAVLDDTPALSPVSRSQPPTPARRRSSAGSMTRRQQQKAVYDFQGESSDELSFQVGDVITVIDTVDDGWWLGEVDHLGAKRRGIFPVNYTEAMANTPSPPVAARPALTTTSSTTTTSSLNSYPVLGSYIQEEPADIDPPNYPLSGNAVDSPFHDRASVSHTTAAPPSFNYLRGGSNGLPIASPSPSSTTPIPSSPASKIHRTPPPPPLARANTSTRTPPPPPPSRANGTPVAARAGPCRDCGCDDYVANVFKKGHCNNCFHKHE
ncbi:BAR-domain-containing protein [Hesseltinella vesiculosa]|uniref:BAR-domain-containing protein n=1 Tax=Hesseltinella vesiculosa TaxID=101127 RepID=A0A1X2GAD0_9FUNG|nr:BAR-domain-containing protein [Hesseltinella vesiculosa]